MGIDIVLFGISFFVAILLHFNFKLTNIDSSWALLHLGIVIFLKIFFSLVYKSYAGVIRHTSFEDAISIVSMEVSALAAMLFVQFLLAYTTETNLFPFSYAIYYIDISALFIDFSISLCALLGVRFLIKAAYEAVARARAGGGRPRPDACARPARTTRIRRRSGRANADRPDHGRRQRPVRLRTRPLPPQAPGQPFAEGYHRPCLSKVMRAGGGTGPRFVGKVLRGGALAVELLFLGGSLQRHGRALPALDGLGDGIEVAGADFALVLDRGETALGRREFLLLQVDERAHLPARVAVRPRVRPATAPAWCPGAWQGPGSARRRLACRHPDLGRVHLSLRLPRHRSHQPL